VSGPLVECVSLGELAVEPGDGLSRAIRAASMRTLRMKKQSRALESGLEMPKIKILGNVLPKASQLTLGTVIRLDGSLAEAVSCVLLLSITKSEISIDCDVSRLDEGDFAPICKVAYQLCRLTTDVMGFAKGVALSVDLHSIIWTDGRTQPIWFYDAKLSSVVTALTAEKPEEVIQLLAREPHLMIVLSDLIDGLRGPNHAPTNCARVIDGIRYAIAGDKIERDKQWAKMRDALNVSAQYMRYISDSSKHSRHNAPVSVAQADASEVGLRTWTIMNRFLEYRKRGNISLPLAEFPLL
jgi:hypothetical protein